MNINEGLQQLTDSDLSFIVTAVNDSFHAARKALEGKDLGDFEKSNYQKQIIKAKSIMEKMRAHW